MKEIFWKIISTYDKSQIQRKIDNTEIKKIDYNNIYDDATHSQDFQKLLIELSEKKLNYLSTNNINSLTDSLKLKSDYYYKPIRDEFSYEYLQDEIDNIFIKSTDKSDTILEDNDENLYILDLLHIYFKKDDFEDFKSGKIKLIRLYPIDKLFMCYWRYMASNNIKKD